MGFGKIVGAAATGGISLLGKDKLLGKKDMGRKAGFMFAPGAEKILKASIPGLTSGAELMKKELDRLKGVDATKLADRTIAKQEVGARQAAQDAIRKGQEYVAQRGMGRSSLGLRAAQRPTQMLAEQINKIRSQKPMLDEQFSAQRMGNIQRATGGLTGLYKTAMGGSAYDKGREGRGRSGGILGLAMGAAGAFGAAKSGGNPMQGMQGGMAMGRGIANLGA